MKLVRPAVTAAVCLTVMSTLGVFAATASAQSVEGRAPELVTDRPDFTESSDVVGAGLVQFEMGTTFESEGQADARDRAMTFPLGLVRIRVELPRSLDDRSCVFVRPENGILKRLAAPRIGASMELERALSTRPLTP